MLISCNPDAQFSMEKAINKYASTSSILKKSLMYCLNSISYECMFKKCLANLYKYNIVKL